MSRHVHIVLKAAAAASLCIAAAGTLGAAAMQRIGTHPTSVLTPYPSIHSLEPFEGRIYFGYGDWNNYPAVVIVSYDVGEGVFVLEHSSPSDSLAIFRVLDGKLWVPSMDPIHYEDFQDYSVLDPAVGWRDRSPVGAYHLFDCARMGSTLFMCGSQDDHERPASPNTAILIASPDGGATWTYARAGNVSRYYWCFSFGTRLYVQEGYYEAGAFVSSNALSAYNYLYRPTEVDGAESPLVVALDSRIPGFAGGVETLMGFDGTQIRTLLTNVRDFAWDGDDLFVLTGGGEVRRATELHADTATWETLEVTGVPANARSLAVESGFVFVGAADGGFWGARADGADHDFPESQVTNEMPDAFGRALATDGVTLAVGAPDADAGSPLSGRAEVFVELPVDNDVAGRMAGAAEVTPAQPDFSGWFGKDLAVDGDLLAVLETGRDLIGSNRGGSAQVHLYQALQDGSYTWRHTRTTPYAHAVALEGDVLCVAAAEVGVFSSPGVQVFRIVREDKVVDEVLLERSITQPPGSYAGYEPSCRVVLKDGFVIAGFSGDVSRDGAPGLVAFARQDPETGAFPSQLTLVAESAQPARFGYSVSYDRGWLAAGAPRDDAGAAQSGSVTLYRRDEAGGNFEFQQTLACPVQQAEALFGSSVAVRNGVLLVGAPGIGSGGVPKAGAVFRYLLGDGGEWAPEGEMERPPGSLYEFGVEVVIGETFLAAGSRGSAAGESLAGRVAIEPNPRPDTPFDRWLESRGLAFALHPFDADGDMDGVVTLLEYVANLNPAVADATVAFPGFGTQPYGLPSFFQWPGEGVQIHWVTPYRDPRLTVALERSHGLSQWSDELRPPTTDDHEFYRSHRLPAITEETGGSHAFRLRASYLR